MAYNPYTDTPVGSSYNNNPPSDDGSQTEANTIKWATHKDKIGDPLKVTIESMNTNVTNAFSQNFMNAKTAVGGDIALDITAHGKVYEVTGVTTITLPPAGTVSSGWFVVILRADAGNDTTIDGNVAETINGSATMVLEQQWDWAICMSDGSNFLALKTQAEFQTGTSMMFQQTSAPVGWTKGSTHDDKAVRLVTGTPSTGGSVAFSTVFGITATDTYTLTTSDIPSHDHSFSDTDTVTASGTQAQAVRSTDAGVQYAVATASGAYLHHRDQFLNIDAVSISGTTGTAGTGGSHSHNIDLQCNYVDFIIADKD